MIQGCFWGAASGVLDRLVLKDEQWARSSPQIIGDERTRCSSGRDNRLFVEAVLWIVRTGSLWPDLPEASWEWSSVLRLPAVSHKEVWWRIFEAIADDPGFEYLIVNSTIMRAHQRASGAKGSSRSGVWTLARRPEHQIHMAVRGLGCPVRFALTAGHRGDAPQADTLIEDLPGEVVMADVAYDSDQIRRKIKGKGA